MESRGYTESSGITSSAKRFAVAEGIGLLTATTVVAQVFDDNAFRDDGSLRSWYPGSIPARTSFAGFCRP
jgi:hypothetical protein